MNRVALGLGLLLIIGGVLVAIGGVGIYTISDKIQSRVNNFLDPIAHYDTTGYQLSQALFGLSWGGPGGTGLGQGFPQEVGDGRPAEVRVLAPAGPVGDGEDADSHGAARGKGQGARSNRERPTDDVRGLYYPLAGSCSCLPLAPCPSPL